MSLRLRLILVTLAVVVVMAGVNLVSFRLNRGIVQRVGDLARTSRTPLSQEGLLGKTFSIEGEWDERGRFKASEVERLPRSRRPQVRGAIQELDPQARTLTVLGQRIRVPEGTPSDVTELSGDPLGSLSAGTRVELSCQVEPDGAWLARKLEARDVKASDKVKGRITQVDLNVAGTEFVAVEGLRIEVSPELRVSYPQGPLYRMEVATQMALSLEEGLAAAQELLKLRYRRREAGARSEVHSDDELGRAIKDAEERLEDAAQSFAHFLSESVDATRAQIDAARRAGQEQQAKTEEQRVERWLDPLQRHSVALEGYVTDLPEIARRDPDEAQVFLQEVLEPALRKQLAPRVRSYLSETEVELGIELEAIAARSEDAARNVLLANLAGVVLAVASGLLLSRSISGPVLALRDAALAIGRGELDTAVQVRSGDELGLLAETINGMAKRLAATTVSVARLDNVIDSMAGALLLVDAQGRITSVNSAALELLGYTSEGLLGRAFTDICPGSAVHAEPSERELLCKDGSRVPVSFSSAGLRGGAEGGGGFVCLALDISERKRMEEELRRSLSEKELLLREVHHRVKNNLQVVSSILDLQSRTITDPTSLERFQASQDRIRSMVFIHDQLHRTENLESIDLRAYLEQLIEHLAQSHVDPPGRIALTTRLQPLRLDLDRALSCGLIVNELVTNALKHAFDSAASGEVTVSCSERPDGWLSLQVFDNGAGFAYEHVLDDGNSLGMSLVRSQARQLGGRLNVRFEGGAAIEVEFPCEAAGGAA